ncbi:MAG: DNA-deoxyinosine glycosylase [Mycobacterium sp.]
MTRSPLLTGLPPIVGGSPRLLILGNMPSVLSLGVQQYYGNPRNAFWRIVGELFGFSADGSYDERVAALAAHSVAVWDVLRSCRRVGSLDSAVERDSMVANDFAALFAVYPSIERVFFNGAAAEANYRKLVAVAAPVTYCRLPSTSPAHTMAFAAKLAAWREIIQTG